MELGRLVLRRRRGSALPARWTKLRPQIPGVRQVLDEAGAGWSAPWPGRRSRPGRCRPWSAPACPWPDGEAAVVHVPQGKGQRRQLLEVVVAEHSCRPGCTPLAATRPAPGAAAGHRRRRRLALVDRDCAHVGEQRRLPVGIRGLLGAVSEAEPGAVPTSRRRQRAVAHEAAEDHLPLEVRQVMRHGLEDSITDHEVLRLPPPAGVRIWWLGVQANCARPLPPGLATVKCQELIGPPVVKPVDDLLGHDRPELGVVGEHLDRQLLIDDLPDLLLGPVGERHPGAVARSSRTSPRSSPGAG